MYFTENHTVPISVSAFQILIHFHSKTGSLENRTFNFSSNEIFSSFWGN